MNLVRLQYGGGGGELHGAILSVDTTEATLIGKTVFLYKSDDLVTPIARAIFSASGNCTFTIQEEGAYTVKSNNGTDDAEESTTINAQQIVDKVVVGVELSFIATITVNVYSAANDTVYYYEDNDTSKSSITLCTTDTSGHGTATLTVPPSGINIVFYSTVAKDTTNGISAYSKRINVNKNTTEIYVMPDGAIYWHGYQRVPLYIDKVFENINGTYSINTNNIIIGIKSSYARVTCQTNDLIDLSKYTKLRMLSTATGDTLRLLYTSYQKGNAGAYSNREDAVNYPTGTNQITDLNLTKTASPINCCVSIANSTTANSGECIIYALWLE